MVMVILFYYFTRPAVNSTMNCLIGNKLVNVLNFAKMQCVVICAFYNNKRCD